MSTTGNYVPPVLEAASVVSSAAAMSVVGDPSKLVESQAAAAEREKRHNKILTIVSGSVAGLSGTYYSAVVVIVLYTMEVHTHFSHSLSLQ